MNAELHSELIEYILPMFTLNRVGIATTIRKEALSEAKMIRKQETDAILPYYSKIRAEAHFRWNRLNRIRSIFNKLLCEKNEITALPLSFSYDDQQLNEILYFKIWDRRSFVQAHHEHYTNQTLNSLKRKDGPNSDENNEFFLEYTGCSSLTSELTGLEGLWFEELIKFGLLGANSNRGEDKEIKQQYLRNWGYPIETSAPFNSHHPGILVQGKFITQSRNYATGTLFSIDALYTAASFGLTAIDLFTTTGARMNEVLQISLTKDCLVTLNQKASPGTVNRPSYQRLVLRLMPKGRDKLESYFIGTESLNNLNKLGTLLNEHYSGDIPTVPFNKNHPRSHRFTSKPYLFQYNSKHLCDSAITASMRFLLHGLVFISQTSDNIVIKAHLLRHAFATHLVQVEKVPIDIVAE